MFSFNRNTLDEAKLSQGLPTKIKNDLKRFPESEQVVSDASCGHRYFGKITIAGYIKYVSTKVLNPLK